MILSLFGLSKLGTLLPIRYIFRSSLPKNRRFLPSVRAVKFSHSKITGALEIFFLNLQIPSFHFKNQSTKRNFGIQLCLVIFLGPQNGQNCLPMVMAKTFYFFVSLQFLPFNKCFKHLCVC